MGDHSCLNAGAILARSATLPERIDAARSARRRSHSDDAQRVIDRRLADWRRRLTVDGADCLLQRLRLEGIPVSVAAAACSPDLRLETPPGEWWEAFRLGAEAVVAGRCELTWRESGIPFADVLSGFLLAGEALIARAGFERGWLQMNEQARVSAQRRLLERLSDVAKWCYYAEFSRYKAQTNGPGIYNRFVAWLLEEGHAAGTFNQFAALARPLGCVTLFWANNVVETAARWISDRESICHRLELGPDAEIAEFEAMPSDPHNHGRTVTTLRLTTGDRVVYKPASGALATLWREAVDLTFGPACAKPRVVDLQSHSWHTFINDTTSPTRWSDDHYRTLGEVLALGTALGSSDLHYENFVTPGDEGPYLVDHETLLSPGVEGHRTRTTSALRRAAHEMSRSIAATGALPYWLAGPGGALWTANVMGWYQQEPVSPAFPLFVDPNTDRMRISSTYGEREVANSRRADPADALGHLDPLICGFRRGWRKAFARRRDLEDLVQSCSGANVRLIARDTHFYAHLLARGYMPRSSYDVLDRSLLLERLYRPFVAIDSRSDRWKLCRGEHDALIRGDIPCFVLPANELRMREIGGGSSIRLRAKAPIRRTTANLRQMRLADADVNADLIRAAFEATAWPSKSRATRTRRPAAASVSWRARKGLAAEVYSRLRRVAFTGRGDNSVAIVGASLEESGRGQRLGICDASDTYSGISGLGLLAAALHRIDSRPSYRALAMRVGDTLAAEGGAALDQQNSSQGGAFSGTAGVAYALFKLGRLLDEISYCTTAAGLLAASSQRPDKGELDVMSGVAGACLVAGAIAQHSADAAPQLRDFLIDGANSLCQAARRDARGCVIWRTLDQPHGVSGFAHGIAGVTAALARAQAVLGKDLSTLVSDGVSTEANNFVPAQGGWPTHDSSRDNPVVTDVWCYGATGIVVMLLEASTVGIPLHDLWDRAIGGMMRAAPSTDGICHGAAGISLAALRAARLTGDAELERHGRERLDRITRRYLEAGTLQVEPVRNLSYAPGLMCGSSGVALAVIAPEAGDDIADIAAIA